VHPITHSFILSELIGVRRSTHRRVQDPTGSPVHDGPGRPANSRLAATVEPQFGTDTAGHSVPELILSGHRSCISQRFTSRTVH